MAALCLPGHSAVMLVPGNRMNILLPRSTVLRTPFPRGRESNAFSLAFRRDTLSRIPLLKQAEKHV
jgi:hypothetical protein